MAEDRYMTQGGGVPFGGMPPNMVIASQQYGFPPFAIGSQQAHYVPVYPRPDLGTIPGWQPWQESPFSVLPPYTAHATYTATTFAAPAPAPPPAAPAPPVAAAAGPPQAAPARPPLPPGSLVPNTDKPLVLPSGQGYIFPQAHTNLHIIESNFAPWENPGRRFHMRTYRAPVSLSIKELIEQLISEKNAKGEKLASRGVTECLEIGNGAWLKGSEFWIGEKGKEDAMKSKVGQTLGKVGWDEKRGVTARPVWLAVMAVLEK